MKQVEAIEVCFSRDWGLSGAEMKLGGCERQPCTAGYETGENIRDFILVLCIISFHCSQVE